MSHPHKWLLLILFLLGFWLRIHQLEDPSMWSDEGLSLYRAQQPIEQVWQNVITVDGVDTRDTNPPFYFFLLHLWRAVAGETVFALRFLGAMAGLLNVPLLYGLGRALWGESAGTTAALLLTISPFHVWESQVLRNYPLLLFFNLLSVYSCWLLVRIWQPANAGKTPPNRQLPAILCWLIAGLLGIYTHYFGFFVFLFTLTVIGWWGIGRYGQPLWAGWRKWAWLAGGVVAFLLLLPIATIAFERFRAGQQVDFPDLSLQMFWENLQGAFAVGISPQLTQPTWRVLPVFGLATIGLWQGWRANRLATLFVLGYQILPFAILLGLSTINPLYNGTRHLLIGLPPFLLLVGQGFQFVPASSPQLLTAQRLLLSILTILLGFFTIASQTFWLHTQFTAPALHQDGVKGLANYLNQHAQANDLVLLHDTLIKFTFDYYYHGDAPVMAIPAYDQYDPPSAIQSLQQAAAGKRLIWFATLPVPRNGFDPNILTNWADTHWAAIEAKPFPGLWLPAHLVVYQNQLMMEALPPNLPAIEQPFGNTVQLRAADLPPTLQSGKAWWYTLYWEKIAPFEEQLMVIWQLQDSTGQIWAKMNQAITFNLPLRLWESGQLMQIAGTITPPDDLPAGIYQLSLAVAQATTGKILPLSDGLPQLLLGQIQNVPTSCSAKYSQRLVPEIGLVSVQLSDGMLRPGHAVQIHASWCARRVPTQNYGWQLEVLDPFGAIISQTALPFLSRADHPPTEWQIGEWVGGQGQLTVPASTPTGEYQLQLHLTDAQTGNPIGQTIPLTQTLPVQAWELVTTLPAIPTPLSADFGQPLLAKLPGFEMPSPPLRGTPLPITLFWQSQSDLSANYAVLLHLTNAQDEIVAQGDGIPLSGLRPTSSWRKGEVLVDTHQIFLPVDLPAGSYQLWVGLYDPITFQRVPAFVQAIRQPHDRILLQTIQITDN